MQVPSALPVPRRPLPSRRTAAVGRGRRPSRAMLGPDACRPGPPGGCSGMRVVQRTATGAAIRETVLVQVRDLSKHFPIGGGIFGGQTVRAVDGVSFEIRTGETLGLVGESGCGKSTLGRLLVQLLPVTTGHVHFKGIDLVALKGERLRRMRQEMQMIFQDPYASLNPRMSVGEIIAEPLRNFGITRELDRRRRVGEVMRLCGLNPGYSNRYPHEFSAGQRQRIGIARALALNPSFIVAD